MKDYEDEAFDELDKAQQLKITGVTAWGVAVNFKSIQPPKPVGVWILYPGAAYTHRFMMYAKPTDEQIKNTEQLLGWRWEDV